MSDKGSELAVLFVGVDSAIVDFVLGVVRPTSSRQILDTEEFLSLLDSPGVEHYQIVISGPLLAGMSAAEVAQSVRSVLRQVPIYYIHGDREAGFDAKNFQKNGFTDSFLFPYERDIIRSSLEDAVARVRSLAAFRPVRMVDIEPGQKLDFDIHVFLPLNGKYIHYSAAGQSLDSDRVQKLKTHKVGSIFVPVDQMEKFYEYSAEKLKLLSDNESGVSETEKRARLQTAVRDLMGGIFSTSEGGDFAGGRKMLEDTSRIIRSYVTKKSKGNLYGQIMASIGDVNGSYSHLSNVSTFAALFSMATGIGEPEELALAGMFHDIGLSAVPFEIQEKSAAEWTSDERAIYQRHPEYSLNLIKVKHLSVSATIQTMILQHHERVNQSGYPHGISEPKLKIESQILGIADEFDELTHLEAGKAALSPENAFKKMKECGQFSISLLDRIMSALQEP